MFKALQVLIAIKIVGTTTWIRFQQFELEDIVFEGDSYVYTPFTLTLADRNIDFESSSGTISIPNTPVARQQVLDNDGFRKSPVLAYFIRSDDSSIPVWPARYQISGVEMDDSTIQFTVKSNFHASNGEVPSLTYRTKDFGKLPHRNIPGRFR